MSLCIYEDICYNIKYIKKIYDIKGVLNIYHKLYTNIFYIYIQNNICIKEIYDKLPMIWIHHEKLNQITINIETFNEMNNIIYLNNINY